MNERQNAFPFSTVADGGKIVARMAEGPGDHRPPTVAVIRGRTARRADERIPFDAPVLCRDDLHGMGPKAWQIYTGTPGDGEPSCTSALEVFESFLRRVVAAPGLRSTDPST